MKIKTVKQRKMEQLGLMLNGPGVKSHRSIEWKDIGGVASTKTNDEGKVIASGYLNAFGNKDSHKDVVHMGAFTKSILERGPASNTPRKMAFLYAHNSAVPIGKFVKLEELTQGLYYEAELDGIPFVKDTIIPQLKSGTLNNHSIGYNYVWDKGEYDEDEDTYHWHELETFEGSLLTMGSNEHTPFTGFKTFKNLDTINDLADQANACLRNVSEYKVELELRGILNRYQSLIEFAAGEITAMKTKPTKTDIKKIIANFEI